MHKGNASPWVSKSHFIKFYHLSWTTSTHPKPHLTPDPEFPSPALWAALNGSLREGSTFSFHPLLEDKHQSHLAAHPYSWAAYKYLIAASLQLFSLECNVKRITHTHIQINILPQFCMPVHIYANMLKRVLFSFLHTHTRTYASQTPDIGPASPSGSTCLAPW